MDEPKWLTWAKQLQAIAQAGMEYSKDDFDLERFEMIRAISMEIMSHHTGASEVKVKDLFAGEKGYQTPKVDVRAVLFKDNKIVMVREKADGNWTLPGGWADIGLSPSENAVKETKEETGYEVKPLRLIGILDKAKHPHPPSAYHIYKIFIRCEIVGGKPAHSLETDGVDFFEEHDLPPLSASRITKSQIHQAFTYLKDPNKAPFFD